MLKYHLSACYYWIDELASDKDSERVTCINAPAWHSTNTWLIDVEKATQEISSSFSISAINAYEAETVIFGMAVIGFGSLCSGDSWEKVCETHMECFLNSGRRRQISHSAWTKKLQPFMLHSPLPGILSWKMPLVHSVNAFTQRYLGWVRTSHLGIVIVTKM